MGLVKQNTPGSWRLKAYIGRLGRAAEAEAELNAEMLRQRKKNHLQLLSKIVDTLLKLV